MNIAAHCPGRPSRLQRGLSLVEMMVGIAVGLIVVAGATLLVSTQLVENRRLVVDTQLQQDLRAAVDIVTRELRRVGTQTETHALANIWYDSGGSVYRARWNAYSEYRTAVCGTDPTCFGFAYQADQTQVGPYGFRLTNGVIRTLLADGGWHDLTDGNVLKVTTFQIRELPRAAAALTQIPCPKLCPPGAGGPMDCWPSVRTRELEVTIVAEDRATGTVERSMTGRVRLRNDLVGFYDAAAGEICPS